LGNKNDQTQIATDTKIAILTNWSGNDKNNEKINIIAIDQSLLAVFTVFLRGIRGIDLVNEAVPHRE